MITKKMDLLETTITDYLKLFIPNFMNFTMKRKLDIHLYGINQTLRIWLGTQFSRPTPE